MLLSRRLLLLIAASSSHAAHERLHYRPESGRVMRSLRFTCPKVGCIVGQSITITDTDGQKHIARIPEGARPGKRVEVFVPSTAGDALAASNISELSDCLARRADWISTVDRGIEGGWSSTQKRGKCPKEALVRNERSSACTNISKAQQRRTCSVPSRSSTTQRAAHLNVRQEAAAWLRVAACGTSERMTTRRSEGRQVRRLSSPGGGGGGGGCGHRGVRGATGSTAANFALSDGAAA